MQTRLSTACQNSLALLLSNHQPLCFEGTSGKYRRKKTLKTKLQLFFAFRNRLVEAAAIQIWNLRAHRTQVGGELSPMMDGVIEHELQIHNSGQIINTEERHSSGPKFCGQLFDLIKLRRHILLVGRSNVGGAAEVGGHGVVFHGKLSGEETVEEPDVRGGQMPGKFQGATRIWSGAVISLISGNGFQNAQSGRVFLPERR